MSFKYKIMLNPKNTPAAIDRNISSESLKIVSMLSPPRPVTEGSAIARAKANRASTAMSSRTTMPKEYSLKGPLDLVSERTATTAAGDLEVAMVERRKQSSTIVTAEKGSIK